MKTFMAKPAQIEKKWYMVDANNQVLGRMASQIATILRGKHKPIYTPYVDTGDFVVVINAEKVILTGRKKEQKFYYRHSGYPGGLKSIRYDKLLVVDPQKAIRLAVKRMLPKGVLSRTMLSKLKVYRGQEHPHQAQQVSTLDVDKLIQNKIIIEKD